VSFRKSYGGNIQMNKLVKASLLVVGLSISAFASDRIPVNTKGDETNPAYAGSGSCEVSSSTSTRALLCASGSGIILGVYGSSVAATDQLVLRDSATANTSSTKLLTVDLTALAKGQLFPRFKNGLSVNALVAPTADGATSHPAWTIIYTNSVN
jgi:hypothetical protein